MIYENDNEFKPQTRNTKKDNLDYVLIERLAKIQCTEYEICAILGIAMTSFINWRKDDTKLREALDNGYADGKMSLRRAQFQVAFPDPDKGYHGNPAMLIWLGKQVLHQSDKVQVSGGKEPIKIKVIWGDLPDENDNENDNDNDKNETKSVDIKLDD